MIWLIQYYFQLRSIFAINADKHVCVIYIIRGGIFLANRIIHKSFPKDYFDWFLSFVYIIHRIVYTHHTDGDSWWLAASDVGEIVECILNDNQSAAQWQSLVGFNQLLRSDTGDHWGLVMTGWSQPSSPLTTGPGLTDLTAVSWDRAVGPGCPLLAQLILITAAWGRGWGPTLPRPGGKLPDIRNRAQTLAEPSYCTTGCNQNNELCSEHVHWHISWSFMSPSSKNDCLAWTAGGREWGEYSIMIMTPFHPNLFMGQAVCACPVWANLPPSHPRPWPSGPTSDGMEWSGANGLTHNHQFIRDIATISQELLVELNILWIMFKQHL